MDVVERDGIDNFEIPLRDSDTAVECLQLVVLIERVVEEDGWIDRARMSAKLLKRLDRVMIAAFHAGRRDLAEQLGHRLAEDSEKWQTQQNEKLGS